LLEAVMGGRPERFPGEVGAVSQGGVILAALQQNEFVLVISLAQPLDQTSRASIPMRIEV
jgi:hypothetical protein